MLEAYLVVVVVFSSSTQQIECLSLKNEPHVCRAQQNFMENKRRNGSKKKGRNITQSCFAHGWDFVMQSKQIKSHPSLASRSTPL